MFSSTRQYLLTILIFLSLLLFGVACTTTEEPAAATATAPVAAATATQVVVPTQTPAATATSVPTPTTNPLSVFSGELEAALAERNLETIESLLAAPFAFGPYRSEWSSYSPGEAVEQMGNSFLIGDAAVAFTNLNETEIGELLDGMPPRSVLPPDAPVATVIHSTGWGTSGADEGILYIYDTEAGLRWSALLYLPHVDTETAIPFQQTEVAEIITVADTVDFYAGPNATYPVVATVFGGQRYPVVGISENGMWWKLACGDDEGLFDECWAPMDAELVQAYEESYERVAPPAGLLYAEADVGLWWLDADLTPRLLTTRTDVFAAPSGTQGVYFDEAGQLWHMDFDSGERRQLTEEQNLNRHAVWLDETAFLTGVYLTPEEMDGPNNGHLARIDVTTGELTVLVPDALSFGHPAVSADGAIAYDAGGNRYLLPAGETEPALFDPAAFAGWQGEPSSVGLLQPAFSPDGGRLAWLAMRGESSAVAVFDLEAQTVSEIFAYDPARFGGLPPRPVWSPDGNRIAVRILANGIEGTGLWIISLDGAAQYVDYNVSDPVWLDDEQVLFSHYRYEGRTPIERVNATSGERRELDLSGNVTVIGVVAE